MRNCITFYLTPSGGPAGLRGAEAPLRRRKEVRLDPSSAAEALPLRRVEG